MESEKVFVIGHKTGKDAKDILSVLLNFCKLIFVAIRQLKRKLFRLIVLHFYLRRRRFE